MSTPETARRPSFLVVCAALLLALICSLLVAPASEAKSGTSAFNRASHGQAVDHAERRRGTHRRRHVARTSRRKHRKPVAEEPAPEPTPTPEETTAVPTEPTPTPTEPAPTPTEPTEPTPIPTEPAPEPTGDPANLIFSGTHISDFWLNQSASGAVSEVTDPAGSSQKVFKMTVDDSDVYPITPTSDPRAQLLSPQVVRPGDEIWWSSKFYLPGSFPSSVPGWLNLLEGPYGQPYNGSPPWQIQVSGNYIQWQRNRTYSWDVPWRMPLVKEKWVEVLVHTKFGSEGWVEMWINGQQITFFSGGTYNPSGAAPATRLKMATMDASNNGGPNEVIIQSYRKLGMFSSVTAYLGPVAVGSSRASVGG
jgi:Polysaccharide lyase